MLSSQVEREEPLVIIGPPKVKEYVEENCRILEMFINYKIIVKEITKPGVVYEGDGFRVSAFWLSHSRPCMGYTLEEDKRPGIFYPEKAVGLGVLKGPLWSRLQHGEDVVLDDGRIVHPDDVMGEKRSGRKVSYITDTIYKPDFAGYIEGSDLLICEGMFAEDMKENAFEKKHLTARQAARIALEAKVKKMGLIHYSPRYTRKELKKLLAEACEIFHQTFLTKDCQIIEIPYEEDGY
jgi:ribonuclease Z